MPREVDVFFKDILQAINRIEAYTKGVSYEAFHGNNLVQDAVVRNLEIIGEAVKHIPEGLQKQYPDIEWKKIAGLRDILIHAYFGIDKEIVWDVVENKLPDRDILPGINAGASEV
jgi:uncharacterized protein with HEPN domain